MKNTKTLQRWLAFFSGFFLVLSMFTLFTGLRVYKKTFKTTPNEIKRKRVHEWRLRELEKYQHQKFFVDSPKNKYNVEAIHIKSPLESNNVMVIVHGIRGNYFDLMPVAQRYLQDGYNVIMYNQRQSGQTGGKNSTFGLYEKFDLEAVATIARRMYRDGKVGVHGFSMGAATAIMQSELNEKNHLVDFYILDAPFHTMASAVQMSIRNKQTTKIPPGFVTFSGDAFLRLRQRVSYKDIAPIDVIHHSTKPILLIHGEKDLVTCPNGSRELFAAISHNSRRLEIFEDGEHCTNHTQYKEDYYERVHRFISDYL